MFRSVSGLGQLFNVWKLRGQPHTSSGFWGLRVAAENASAVFGFGF